MKRETVVLSAIVALGLVVRVIYVLTLQPEIFWYDGYQYSRLATGLVQHGVYALDPGRASAFWPPGYPVLLAAIYSVFGVSVTAVRLVQCLLGALAVLLTHAIATRVLDPAGARLAALGSALYPLFIYSAGAMFPVTLLVTLLAACVWLALLAVERASLRAAAGAGLCAGWAGLTTGTVLPGLLLIAPWMAWPVGAGRDRARGSRLAVVYLLVLFALVGGWALRNQRVFGRPVMISTNFGYNFWLGNYPGVKATTGSRYDRRGMDAEAQSVWQKPGTEASRDAEFTRLAIGHILSDLPGFARLTLSKAGEFWAIYSEPMTLRRPRSRIEWPASLLSYGLLLPFAAVGLLRSLPRSRFAVLVFSLASLTTLVHAVTLAKLRYRLPLDTFVILYGAGGVVAAARWFRGRLGARPGT
jgi:4-amino-4-deoxy-L-arabinose transferase-like glycosyltransferase